MSENDRLANEMFVEISRAFTMWLTNKWSSEQLLNQLKNIFKASNL